MSCIDDVKISCITLGNAIEKFKQHFNQGNLVKKKIRERLATWKKSLIDKCSEGIKFM